MKDQSQEWRAALNKLDDPLPAGFAFFTMGKIVAERLRRAEQSARWQATYLAVALAVTAVLALFALREFGYGQFAWAATLPWFEFGVITALLMSLLALDTLIAGMLRRRRDA
ncbi:MAG: hypothetical protein ACE37D_15115 [Pseudomonadales bacterium]|jgi:hypothetical protein